MLISVGHGRLDRGGLTELLRSAGIGAVVDIRRFPGSRRNPDVDRDALHNELQRLLKQEGGGEAIRFVDGPILVQASLGGANGPWVSAGLAGLEPVLANGTSIRADSAEAGGDRISFKRSSNKVMRDLMQLNPGRTFRHIRLIDLSPLPASQTARAGADITGVCGHDD